MKEIIDIISEYIDFINHQKGMYIDACAGFSENKRVIELQKARVQKASGLRIGEHGQPIVMMASLEDPSSPDAIHHRIIRADDYIAQNSANGSHEQQHAKGIIVFIFHFWEDEIRYRLSKAKSVSEKTITSDILGDVRLLRNAIIHDKGILLNKDHSKMKLLKDLFQSDMPILLTNEIMHKIFELIEKDTARLMLQEVGPLPEGIDKQTLNKSLSSVVGACHKSFTEQIRSRYI